MKPKLFIVGGGYGGTDLVKTLGSAFEVTVIERKEAFFHHVGALRSSVNATWSDKLFVPYRAILKDTNVIQGEVVSVTASEVVLSDGQTFAFDYLVLATGSSYPFPGHASATSVAEAKRDYQNLYEKVKQAKSILIVGGGPVGLELAGEISSVYPQKRLTLVHGNSELIGAPFNPEFGRRLQGHLERRSVKIILNELIDASDDGAKRFTTNKGTSVEADLVLRAFGAKPNTNYLRQTLPDVLDKAGYVKVNTQLQLEGHANIFAIGDITDIKEPKLALVSAKHAKVVAHNLKALLSLGALKNYKPAKVPIALVPLGPKGGAGHLPFGKGLVVNFLADIKGKTLMTEQFRKMIESKA
jgi:apoptosis-inducing factor 2